MLGVLRCYAESVKKRFWLVRKNQNNIRAAPKTGTIYRTKIAIRQTTKNRLGIFLAAFKPTFRYDNETIPKNML
jgi:hypothetical protein